MGTPVIQPSWSAGEISPELAARVDLPQYRVSAALMRNFYVNYAGGALNRPGLKFSGELRGASAAADGVTMWGRMIPFVFSETDSYGLVFGNGTLRFVYRGSYVLEATLPITGITQATEGVITSVAHGLVNGDLVYLAGIGGMIQLNNRYFGVASVTANTFKIVPSNSGVPIDTSGYSAYTAGGTVSRIYTIVSPYILPDVNKIKYVQSADVMTLTALGYLPRTLTRTSHTSWAFATITFAASIAAPTNLAVTTNLATGSTDYAYKVTTVSASLGDESQPTAAEIETAEYFNANLTNRVTWDGVAGASHYHIYRAPYSLNRGVPGSALYGRIGTSAGTGARAFDDPGIAADFSRTPPQATNPFDAVGKAPGCVTYFQQRLMFAGSVQFPNTLWGSKIGAFNNMDFSIPASDDDAVIFTLASQRIDLIQSILAMPGGLLVFTAGDIYQVSGGGQNEPITPGSVIAQIQSHIGSADIIPLPIGNNVLYVQFNGSTVRNLAYNFLAQGYETTDLTVLSTHLFRGHTIVDWDYAEEPWKTVYAVRDDGKVIVCTFVPEQDIFAWSLWETDGLFKSVCVIPENGEDVAYFVVQRSLGTRPGRFGLIERLQTRLIHDVNAFGVDDIWFVDCGLQLLPTVGAELAFFSSTSPPDNCTVTTSGGPFTGSMLGYTIRAAGGIMVVTAFIDSNNVTCTWIKNSDETLFVQGTGPKRVLGGDWSYGPNVLTVSGLWHVEGATLVGLADGAVVEGVVTEGVFTLNTPASLITLGFPYTCRLKSSRLDVGEPTIQTKRKKINAVTLRLNQSRGVKYGLDFETMEEFKPRSDEQMGAAPNLATGDRRIVGPSDWNEEGQICIEQSYPLPAEVLGLIPEVTVGN